jgi:Family of unknown function (DUF5947)
MEALLKLRRFVEPAAPKAEKCELCGAEIPAAHSHIVDSEKHKLLCACRPCYLLFTHSGAAGGKLRSVSERYRKLPRIDLLCEEIPVGIAFFIRDSASNRIKGFYPSPAGATESEIVIDAPDLEPDIEALLVNKHESWIVPADACYELIGRIRKTWRGFDGGAEAWREIDSFFANLQEKENDRSVI